MSSDDEDLRRVLLALRRIEDQNHEILRLLRGSASGGDDKPKPIPPAKTKFVNGKWLVWCGEGTGWGDYHGPIPPKGAAKK
jgi:hypothetical protein